MEKYEGSLNINKMSGYVKKAYKSWKDQGDRCNNPKNPRYEFYGKKGIKRIYGSREFIGWYVSEAKKNDNWKLPSVDRIDSNGNYDFGNIQLIELSDNVKRRNLEHGNPCESVMIKTFDGKSGELLFVGSKRETERLTSVSRRDMDRSSKNNIVLRNGFCFKYCE